MKKLEIKWEWELNKVFLNSNYFDIPKNYIKSLYVSIMKTEISISYDFHSNFCEYSIE